MSKSVILIKSNHSKSIHEVFARTIWFFCWKTTASWTPRFFNLWRVFLLRAFGAKLGKRVLVLGSVWVDMPWNLVVGDYSAIGKRVWLYNFAKVKIGSNTVISQDTTICTSSHDYTHPHMPLFSKAISIGSQVWIGAECFVMPDVSIGDGVVVGARSLVTKDLTAWMVCVGHPCREYKRRSICEVAND